MLHKAQQVTLTSRKKFAHYANTQNKYRGRMGGGGGGDDIRQTFKPDSYTSCNCT